MKPSGKVYVVGAGPGDPELLTLKAARVLRDADIVLHDDLISSDILGLIPGTATVISVGKRCGAARVSQEEINVLMTSYARAGRDVVRLKSGDPLLFGRAGEEIDALRVAGVDFEIVPGISAAFAAAAALQTSLTDRRKSARVVFSAGHRASAHSEEGVTHVIYMPGADYTNTAARLLAEGLPGETPCVVVSAASQENESVCRSTLANLPHLTPLPSPAILLAGAVVEDDHISHFAQSLSRQQMFLNQ
jgi:uroporphyrin-III C-methyltransferase